MTAAIEANVGRSVGSSATAITQAATAATAVWNTASRCGRTRRRAVAASERGVSFERAGSNDIGPTYYVARTTLLLPRSQVGEHREHAAVVIIRRREVELAED